MKLFKKLQKFRYESKGAAMVEFALILPLLMTISLGIYEATNYIMLSAKLNEISSGVANWVSSKTTIAEIQDCLIGANLVGRDYRFSSQGGVVVSGLQQVSGSTSQQLVWQYASPGGKSQLSTNPRTGVVQSAPFSILSNKQVIIAEATYDYQPIFTYFLGIFPSVKLLKVAQIVPRGGQSFSPLAPS